MKSFWSETWSSFSFNCLFTCARSVFFNLSNWSSLELIISNVLSKSFCEFANSRVILFKVSLSVFISKLSFEISFFICEEFASIFLISLVTELISLFKFAANSCDLTSSLLLKELLIFEISELYWFCRASFFSCKI